MNQGDHHKMMMERLNLTDTQKDAVEVLHFSHKREMIDLKAALEKKKLDKQELLSKGNYTRDNYLGNVKAISDAKDIMAIAKANRLVMPEEKYFIFVSTKLSSSANLIISLKISPIFLKLIPNREALRYTFSLALNSPSNPVPKASR